MARIRGRRGMGAAVAGGLLALAPLTQTAWAAKPSPAPSSSSAMTQSYSYTSLNPNDPSWCYSEDDFYERTWSGSLKGTFSASERLCDQNVDYYNGIWWNSGGEGIYVRLDVVGSLTDMSITSPTGDVHHAVLVGSTTSKGVTTNHYEACYMPPFSKSSGTGGTPVPGGTWSVAISGAMSRVTFSDNVEMGYVDWQESNCPASEQNLVS